MVKMTVQFSIIMLSSSSYQHGLPIIYIMLTRREGNTHIHSLSQYSTLTENSVTL